MRLANLLEFVNTKTHKALFKGHSQTIPATLVDEGPAKGWMRMPVPNHDPHPCDYDVGPGKHCDQSCPGCKAPWYMADAACPTNCAKAFPGLPVNASADKTAFPNPFGQPTDFHSFAIEDELAVPTSLPAGEYVLGWRWDCEMTSQVWSSCADITIV